jgi:hypothetical protein
VSSKSNTSKFSARRSWVAAFGTAVTLRWLDQPAQRDLTRALPVRFADLGERAIARDPPLCQRRICRQRHIALHDHVEEGILTEERVVLDISPRSSPLASIAAPTCASLP